MRQGKQKQKFRNGNLRIKNKTEKQR